MINESTDISITHKMVVYTKLMNCSGRSEIHFLKNIEVCDGTAEGIYSKLKDVCADFEIPLQKVKGFCSDGASVMVGRKTGVSARLKSDSSGLVSSVHCVAHRLAFAASQAIEGIPFLEKLQTSISKLFQYIRSSTNRMHKFTELQDMLDDEKVQLVAVHQVRWLSMHRAVRALHKSFPSVLLLLEHDASEDKVTAHGLHSFLNKSVALLSVALLRDVLSIITTLSTVFFLKEGH
ncbi:hypothetical protein HOLleu_03426 [Holothuria leucospilota]|uniref:Uncharacterized protein n=1 Tax=Holothuria leucospilota TaxID=206669 RepID=A0A9Q1CT04_HOLLE|nr:hypothetical protein HOLleu_03426 [Holothuria leucospilota]